MPLTRDTTFAAIDFESAGARKGATDVPIQVGIACMGEEIDTSSFFRSFLYTDQPVTWAASKVHGIAAADLAQAPSMLQLWPEFDNRMRNRVIVAHGSGTEKRFLRAFPMHGFGPWVDTLKLAHAVYPEADQHGLGPLLESLGLRDRIDQLCPDYAWHDALYDAVGSLVLLEHFIAAADLSELPVEDLIQPERSEYYAARLARSKS